MMTASDKVPVLLAAGGEAWEAGALRALAVDGVIVLKRCVDLADLLATAATGQAGVAVVSGELTGLDADAVMQLLRHDVRCVAVGGDSGALERIGVVRSLALADLAALPDAVRAAGARDLVIDPDPLPEPSDERGVHPGRLVAVHGPGGAPGRTTLAIGLAAEHARRGEPSILVDADPYGGVVAQHLGVLDEVSGLLAAARLVNSGGLDATSFARCRRRVAHRCEVLTGLPRPDRWVEVRPGALEMVLDRAAEVADVVVDTGFSLEDADSASGDPGRSRNQLTLDAVARADLVVVVGSAEPVGLARLARTLVELRDVSSAPLLVVVNRMRDSLGWSRRDILGMVEGYVRPAGVHFLPDDRAAADRALVSGRSPVELGDSALARAISEVHDAAFAAMDRTQKPPISR
jgi:MinD-like ATPase involved in chromosome partitioning or flagellar assembly